MTIGDGIARIGDSLANIGFFLGICWVVVTYINARSRRR